MNEDICKKAIERKGSEYMLNVCMEECAELIQAISKARRYGADRTRITNLSEEMADVLICLKELQIMYGIGDVQLAEWVRFKQDRTLKRLETEDED